MNFTSFSIPTTQSFNNSNVTTFDRNETSFTWVTTIENSTTSVINSTFTASLTSTPTYISKITDPTKTVTNGNVEGTYRTTIIIISVVFVLLFLLMAFIIAFILTRRRSCFKSTRPIGYKPHLITTKPIPSDKYLQQYTVLCKDSYLKLYEEFMMLKDVGLHQSTDVATMKQNISKNRYTNILPYNNTRVKLMRSEDEEGSDYINASWIPGYISPRQYIACQGPMLSTQDDFWRMVWEYSCCAIVMLTKCVEKSRDKCYQYWPNDDEPKLYGDIEVKNVSEKTEENWNIKTLIVSMGNQMREVTHLHFLNWNDMEAPAESGTLLSFVEIIRKISISSENEMISPLVVHCSAGVGRTGAYIAIDSSLYQHANSKTIDVYGTTFKMRMARSNMIQNESQYTFVYKTLAHVIESQQPSITSTPNNQEISDESDLIKSPDHKTPERTSNGHATVIVNIENVLDNSNSEDDAKLLETNKIDNFVTDGDKKNSIIDI